jgi:hypothetical protein
MTGTLFTTARFKITRHIDWQRVRLGACAFAVIANLGVPTGIAAASPQPLPGLNPQISAPALGVGGYIVVVGTSWPPLSTVQVKVTNSGMVGSQPQTRTTDAHTDPLGDFTLPVRAFCGPEQGGPLNQIAAQSGNPAEDGYYIGPINDYCY